MDGFGHRFLKIAGVVSFYSYLAALFVLGLAGVLMPERELDMLYDLSLEAPQPAAAAAASLPHQYRFLKSFVVGFGVFALLFRREILRPSVYNKLFLSVLFGAAAVRVLSILWDGRPHPFLINFTISELVFGAFILAASRLQPASGVEKAAG
jgi:hypothetical protein